MVNHHFRWCWLNRVKSKTCAFLNMMEILKPYSRCNCKYSKIISALTSTSSYFLWVYNISSCKFFIYYFEIFHTTKYSSFKILLSQFCKETKYLLISFVLLGNYSEGFESESQLSEVKYNMYYYIPCSEKNTWRQSWNSPWVLVLSTIGNNNNNSKRTLKNWVYLISKNLSSKS